MDHIISLKSFFLQQLEERGLLEDMDVYEDLEMDDSLATESPGCGFGQLEGVIGKVCELYHTTECGMP